MKEVSFSAYLAAQHLDLQCVMDYLDNDPSHPAFDVLYEAAQKQKKQLNAFAEVFFPQDSILMMMSDWENQFAFWVSESEYQAKKAAALVVEVSILDKA